MYEKIIKDANFLFFILYVTGGVKSLCYTDTNCRWCTIPAIDQADCCVGTNDGLAYLDGGGNCTVCTGENVLYSLYFTIVTQFVWAVSVTNRPSVQVYLLLL